MAINILSDIGITELLRDVTGELPELTNSLLTLPSSSRGVKRSNNDKTYLEERKIPT